MPARDEPPIDDLDDQELIYACPPPRGRAPPGVRKRNLVQLSVDINRFRLICNTVFCQPNGRERTLAYWLTNPDVDHRAKMWAEQARHYSNFAQDASLKP